MNLRQQLKNQECRSVTNRYLCEDCTLGVVKRWLKQKRQEVQENCATTRASYYTRLLDELLDDIQNCEKEEGKVKL
jgi:hypothetical protein